MPQKSPVNLNDTLREVLILIRQSLDENGIKLQLQLDESLPHVLAQHIQIDQVILNLTKNAIEAMPQDQSGDKTLLIKTEQGDAQQVAMSITDTGKGIDADIQKRLFTPFATSKKNGMGLGLSISQGIIAEHGGKLKMLGSSETGSTFQFTLPIIED